jgi:prepilin-type N-terminal cleavage/methylation domain-containing protein
MTAPRHRFTLRTPLVAGRCLRAFTLIELLTVIAIIGVLAAILIPVLGRARESSHDSRCTGNLRQIGGAIQAYANDHRGILPPTGFFGVASYYNRDARNFQNSLLSYLDLKPATTWSTSVDTSYSPVFECLSYKGASGGKGYVLHDSNTTGDPAQDANGNTVRPWGLIQDAAGTKVSPAPQRALNMAANEWALRDLDSSEGGNHPGHQNHLYFDWHVGRVAVNN